MPRLSLYRPEKGNDYKFIDKNIWEMFQVGGTDILIHKYLGPGSSSLGDTPSTPAYDSTNPTQIQDMLFLENRDRKYDPDVYVLRGVYNIQDTDFNLSQFGLFLQNDTIFVSFHINDTIEKLGRKLIAGDVIELPHLKDEFALNDLQFALKRFYVIEEISRAAEGFSATWYPHLYRAKCKPLVDSQEFKDILDQVADSEGLSGDTSTTLRDIMSTYEKEMQITQAVLNQAEADVPRSGYDTSKFYTIQRDPLTGNVALVTTDSSTLDASIQTQATDIDGNPIYDENGDPIYVGATSSAVFENPDHKDYRGYLTGDGIPPNGAPFTAGIAFPVNPQSGQYCLRTDYLPNRLFRYTGARWAKMEDVVRHTMNNLGNTDVVVDGSPNDIFLGKDVRQTLKTSFINNDNATGKDKVKFDILYLPARGNSIQTNTTFTTGMFAEVFIGEIKVNASVTNGVGGNALITMTRYANTSDRIQYRLYSDTIPEKQSLSKALRPQADN